MSSVTRMQVAVQPRLSTQLILRNSLVLVLCVAYIGNGIASDKRHTHASGSPASQLASRNSVYLVVLVLVTVAFRCVVS